MFDGLDSRVVAQWVVMQEVGGFKSWLDTEKK